MKFSNLIKKENLAKTIVIAVIVVVALITVIRFVSPSKEDSMMPGAMGQMGGAMGLPGQTKSQDSVNVEVKTIAYENFSKTTNINGELKASNKQCSVVSDVSGKVVEILVNKGDVITADTPVAVVDPSTPGSVYKQRTITSGFDGTVVSVDVYAGQSINSNTTIVELGKPDELILTLNVPEKYLSTVGLGSKATFTTAAYPDFTYNAEVSYLGKSVDTATRTVSTELEITNADSKLMAGMFVKTKVITQYMENVFTVPTKSLSSYLGDTTLYVVKDGKAVRTVVKTGASNDTLTVITEGLSTGDKVVTGGSVTDGAFVNVIN